MTEQERTKKMPEAVDEARKTAILRAAGEAGLTMTGRS
jgi:hypothetical protein